MKYNFPGKRKIVYEEFSPENPEGLFSLLWDFSLKSEKQTLSTIHLLPNYRVIVLLFSDFMTGIRKLLLAGPVTKRIKLVKSNQCRILSASFKVLKFNQISGINVSDITNKVTGFADILGKDIETKFLRSVNSINTVYTFEKSLNRILKNNTAGKTESGKFVSELIKTIIKTDGKLKLSDIYEDFHLNSRTIVRNFTASIGITPKQFSRIVRYKKMTAELLTKGKNQYDILFDGGFFDQSHYCNEFKKLNGEYPSQFEIDQREIIYKKLIKDSDVVFLQ